MILYVLLCILLILIFGGCYYAYRIAFYSPVKGREEIPQIKGEKYEIHRDAMRPLFRKLKETPCEYVTIHSHDGLTLHGRYYHQKDGAPLAIGFHGYRSCWLTDFCGGADMTFRMGQNLLLIDQRGHGKSEGRTITFGIKERQDLLCWVNYAIDRFGPDVKILLYGVSMGGATVLMASGMDLPENVKGIIADCPYSAPLEIITEVGKQSGYPMKLLTPFLILGAKIFGGFDLKEFTAAESVKNSKIPMLIIHGEDDTFVPPDMSLAIQNNNRAIIQRQTFPGAYHCLSYIVDTPRYESIVMDFMKEVL